MNPEVVEALVTQVTKAFTARQSNTNNTNEVASNDVVNDCEEDWVSTEEFERVWKAYRLAMRRLAIASSAIGACVCWGRDFDCQHCGGFGGPGTSKPDPNAFRLLIAPLQAQHPELFSGSHSFSGNHSKRPPHQRNKQKERINERSR